MKESQAEEMAGANGPMVGMDQKSLRSNQVVRAGVEGARRDVLPRSAVERKIRKLAWLPVFRNIKQSIMLSEISQ